MPISPLSSQPPEWQGPAGPVEPSGKVGEFKPLTQDPFDDFMDVMERYGGFDDSEVARMQVIASDYHNGKIGLDEAYRLVNSINYTKAYGAVLTWSDSVLEDYKRGIARADAECAQGKQYMCQASIKWNQQKNDIEHVMEHTSTTPYEKWQEIQDIGPKPHF